MAKKTVYRGISGAAAACKCAEKTLRRLEIRGIVRPVRDDAGRRLFSETDIDVVRAYLESNKGRPGRPHRGAYAGVDS